MANRPTKAPNFTSETRPKNGGRPKGSRNKLVTAREILEKEGFNPIEALVHLFTMKDTSKYFNSSQKKLTVPQQLVVLDLIAKYSMPQYTRVEVEGQVQQKLSFTWDAPQAIEDSTISVPSDALIDVSPVSEVVTEVGEVVMDKVIEVAVDQLIDDDKDMQ